MNPRLPITVLSLAVTASFWSQSANAQSRAGGPARDGGLAGAAEPFSMEVVSGWGGPVSGLEIVGTTAFVGAGRRLVALDLTNEAEITEIGSIDMKCAVQDIAIRDELAYVTTRIDLPGHAAIKVVDISNPGSMAIVGQGNGFGTYKPRSITLHGDLAFVQEWSVAVDVFDISDELNPVHLVAYDSLLSNASACYENTVYAATTVWDEPSASHRIRLATYDIATPSPPPFPGAFLGAVEFNVPQLGQTDYPYASWVTAHAGVVYISIYIPGNEPDWLAIVDVSEPASPSLISMTMVAADGVNNPSRVSVANGFAYITAHVSATFGMTGTPYLPPPFRGVTIVDVGTNPASPSVVGTFSTHGTVRAVEVIGDRAYLFDDGEGLIILDVTTPLSPKRVGSYLSPALLRRAVKTADLLYVVDHWNGFTILDVSEPNSTPAVVGVYQTPLEIPHGDRAIANWDIVVRGSMAYLSAGGYGLQVVDVSNPAQPQFVGGYVLNDPCGDSHLTAMALVADRAELYVYASHLQDMCGAQLRKLVKLNVTDPENIFTVGAIVTQQMLSRIAVREDSNIAFAGQELSGPVLTLDISGSGLPQIINNALPPRDISDLALERDTLYMTNAFDSDPQWTALFVRDVSDPATPVLLSHVNEQHPDGLLFRASAVGAQNDRAYVTGVFAAPLPGGGFGGGVDWTVCYDMSNPAEPTVLGYALAGNGAKSFVTVDEPLLYVGTHEGVDGFGTSQWPVDHGLVIITINGLPSDCPADINGDNTVNVTDLLAVISSWGRCTSPPCAADINGDNVINVTDLLAVISNWGSCD